MYLLGVPCTSNFILKNKFLVGNLTNDLIAHTLYGHQGFESRFRFEFFSWNLIL
jgi:hypothetical protein